MSVPFGQFDNQYARLPARFYQPCEPTGVSSPALLAVNGPLARELGIAPSLSDLEWAQIGSGNYIPDGAEPISLAYAGHQFGHFVPQLGDGRAILMGELRDRQGQLRDLQWKGSGPTPFSRRGDGRAALGPVLREYLVSEFLAAQGVPSTRALCAVTTGELVRRERYLPGAVLIRVAASHVRVGTFQYFAAREDPEALRILLQHVIDRLYPEAGAADCPALALLELVARRHAALIAHWLSLGFVHGVMNTDNAAISGETLDFGPCAFLEAYDAQAVFSSIDERGRYAYGHQATIAHWNLIRLAECWLPLFHVDENRAIDMARGVLDRVPEWMEEARLAAFGRKLGLTGRDDGDADLIDDCLSLLQTHRADFTLSFRALCEPASFSDAWSTWLVPADAQREWQARWHARTAPHGPDLAAMRAANPSTIPRNHWIEHVIEAAIEGNLEPWRAMLAAVTDSAAADTQWARPAADHERVTHTFCGT